MAELCVFGLGDAECPTSRSACCLAPHCLEPRARFHAKRPSCDLMCRRRERQILAPCLTSALSGESSDADAVVLLTCGASDGRCR